MQIIYQSPGIVFFYNSIWLPFLLIYWYDYNFCQYVQSVHCMPFGIQMWHQVMNEQIVGW